ncbi:TonB-dependent receptor [Neolewinella aurantiaca]|uniref:TonB-dependent receptor n=1 Tax=Neolewinella aurantiaca TaxID=2602767 RepID=A0A5C7FK55_9BACT|nr:TonB-dependent receptor [Neolewinella aurantiaca]TXF90251.1 TonB-dependent receptor [Neolewinella aurantiaca]
MQNELKSTPDRRRKSGGFFLRTIAFGCFFLLSFIVGAQERVSGTVTSGDGEPLIGVSVIQIGTTSGAVTDIDGSYSFTLVSGKEKTIRFSYTGFASQEIEVGTQTVIDVTLESDAELLEEIVVIGYGTERKRDVLGSIASIKTEDIAQNTPVSAFDAIQGRLSGVQITGGGGPGEGTDIRIRGTSTLSGGVGPLYVVDGQQLENIDNLDPNSIASIEVLKDGASAAIYGSKSANGVVIITTKKGESGKVSVEVTHNTTVGELYRLLPVANTRQRQLFETGRNGGEPSDTDADSLSTRFQQQVDIQDLLTQTAVRNQTNLAVSGGGEKTKFYWNTGFLDEEGIVFNSSYRRYNTNLTVDFNLGKKFSAGTRLNASYEFRKGLNESSVFRQLAERPAYLPVRDFNGDLFPETFGRQNPVAEALETRRDDRNFRTNLFNFLEFKITPELSLRSTVGVNFRLRKRNNFDPLIVQRPGNPATGSELQDLTHDIQQENYLTYKKNFGKHSISALAGTQIQKWNIEFSRLQAVSFASDLVETFNNVAELNLANTTSTRQGHALASFYGRLSYNFDGKYLIAGTVRRDGSSRFGSDRRYGNFPSVSAGWRVSAEPFWDGLRSTISDFKLRVGYAVTGNERIGNYDARLLYSPGFIYNGVNGVAPTQLSNPALGWESTKQVNYGVDLEFFNGRAAATIDVYRKTTDDLLYNVPLPEESGFGGVIQNIGSIENSGVELTLSGTPINTGKFKWFTSFNIATNDNKVLDLADDDGFESGNFIIKEGEPLGNMFGYVYNGVFAYDESNAFTNEGVQLTPNFDDAGGFVNYTLNGAEFTGEVNQLRFGNTVLRGGDIIWDDLDGDFTINSFDRQVIGNGYADVFGGFFNEFTYAGVSLSFLFDYNFGNDIFRAYDQLRNYNNSFGRTPSPERIEGAWTQQGDVTEWPSMDRRRPQNRINPSSQMVSSGDFIKLRSIRAGYTLPKSLLSKADWISNVRITLAVNNPVTWTEYTGYNPEINTRGNALQPGYDFLRYPSKTEYIFGIQARF